MMLKANMVTYEVCGIQQDGVRITSFCSAINEDEAKAAFRFRNPGVRSVRVKEAGTIADHKQMAFAQ